jgi:cobalt-zinc-cadmium efflux system membrane fusion protein
MQRSHSILFSIGLLACGFGLVIAADRAGWLSDDSHDARDGATAPANVPPSQSIRQTPGQPTDDHGQGRAFSLATMMHTAPATQLPPRHERAPSVVCATQQRVVQLANADVASRAGLRFARVERQPVSYSLECNAELAFNADRLTHIAPRAPGVVKEVMKSIGDRVEAGEVLAIVDSAELGSAKADYLQARALVKLWKSNYERQLELSESGIAAKRSVIESQTSLAEAEISQSRALQRLHNLGLTEDQVQGTVADNETSSLLQIAAPFAGVIIERHAVRGEVVDTNHALFSIADTSTMWAMLDIYERDVRNVKHGQPVVLFINGLEGEQFAGTIKWLASGIDPNTRTLKARADIANPDGSLRAQMFGRAAITVSDHHERTLVPKSAVQWEGCCNVVFVKHTDTVFQPYKVKLGHEAGEYFVVEEGVNAGEEIVTDGAFLLKTEILKGNIGAGCCEVHGASPSNSTH